jgi:predicted permease
MPDWSAEIRARLAGRALERTDEIVEELAQHLDDHCMELQRQGLLPEEARQRTLEQLASEDVLRRALESIERPAAAPPQPLGAPPRGTLMGLGGDVLYALRGLRTRPGLSAVALLTLALGIGANVAIFSVVNAALLRPLPFREPERLVVFWGTAPEKGLPIVNYPDALYSHYSSRSRAVDPLAMYGRAGFTLTGAGDAERLNGGNVTADFLRVLGVSPMLGRGFLPEEETRGKNVVALLGWGLWQRRFGGDPGIVGRSIDLNGIPTQVVGIMPRGFDFPNRSELWVPLGIDPQATNCYCYWALGRLRAGLDGDALGREIDDLNEDFYHEREGRPRRPAAERKRGTVVVPISAQLVGEARTPMLVLLGAVGMVLLIACANVANLLLSRAVSRSREIAVRCCLGASPWRVARQLLAESGVLALIGSALGFVVALVCVRLLEPLALERMPHLQAIALDRTVLLFTLGLTVATALLFGLAPALRGARVDLQEAVRDGARGSRGARSRGLNDAFVVTQFALSLVLLIGAGLLLRSFSRLAALETGFRSERVLVGRVSLPGSVYRDGQSVRGLFDRLRERVEAIPGVEAAGLSSTAPFSAGNNQQNFVVQGKEPAPGQPVLVASVRSVTPSYFGAVRTPLLRGRLFDDRDREGAELVAIVDESLARRHWPDGNAVGQRVSLGGGKANPWRTIVGVVAAVKHQNLMRDPDHYVYAPFAQLPQGRMDVVVRGTGDTTGIAAALRGELKTIDPTLPLFDVHTLEQAVSDSLLLPRLVNGLLLAFALLALLLASIGIYGVMALNVSQRVNEFGIRLALGATPREVRALVLRQGMRLVVLGAALGLAGAAGLTRYLGTLLFQVPPLDPATFSAVTLILLVVALCACYVPARRATALDPLAALRRD